MRTVIDVAADVTPIVGMLRNQGVQTILRYYNHQNSSHLPTKRLTLKEAQAITDAGLSLGVVFQQRGGAGGQLSDLSVDSGKKDAQRAVELATGLGQREGSAIYFAVDHDYFRATELDQIAAYFHAVKESLGGKFLVGAYGNGSVSRHLRSLGLADHVWLSGSLGWSGTLEMLETDQWSLFQKDLNVPVAGTGYMVDGNVVSAAFPDFGQFTLGAGEPTNLAPVATMMEVTARIGLRLRSGPGQSFDAIRTIPRGTLVEAVSQSGDWVQVDLEGDGAADGFMHGSYLRTVSGGLAPPPPPGGSPLSIALAELARGVVEIPGSRHNPRVVLYHGSTSGGAAADEIAWCSSFVNYCVEQAGLQGTNSKWAMSWHDSGWGTEVTEHPKEGDIAVFERRKGAKSGPNIGGHVGFWMGSQGQSISLLGGNQSNRVCYSSYPTGGMLHGNYYRLLSIRRP